VIDAGSSVDSSISSNTDSVRDTNTYEPSVDQQSQDTGSQAYDSAADSTEDRLKRQSTPLSLLASDPSTADRLAGSEQTVVNHTSTLPQGDASTGQVIPASEAAQTAITAAGDLVQETLEAVDTFADPADKIAQLNSDGDQVVMTALAQVEGQVVGGLKLRYGYDITVQQVGDSQTPGVVDDPNVDYQVSFNKRLLGGVGVELPAPIAEIKGELRGFTDDTVIMTFENQAEAAQAVRILQKAALTETVSDADSAVDTVTGQPDITSSDVPPANPLRSPEADAPSVLEGTGVAPTAEELAFLSDHVTGYSQTLGAEARAKFGAEAPALLGYELRIDAADTITRTVTLPSDGEPGRISYTISGAVDSSSKEILDLGPKLFDAFEIAYAAENVVQHGELRSDITLNWDIPASEWTQSGPFNSSLPETSLLTTGNLAPDSIETKLTLTHQAQSLLDPSRTDLMRYTLTSTLDNPVGAASHAVSSLSVGDIDAALTALAADSSAEITAERIDRTGVRQEHGIDFEAVDVVEGKMKIIFEAGVDDVTPLNATEATDPVDASVIDGAGEQLVVVPRNGVNLRSAPGVENSSAAILYHGTFVQPTGNERVDAQGNTWLEVSGPDVNDQPASGWVRADLVVSHPEGAMDESGRINPDLGDAGYRQINVADGDNLWDLAQAEGVGFEEMVALNSGHLIAPDLIFAGDTVYVPNTEGEMLPEVPEEMTSPQNSTASDDSSESVDSTSPDSSSTPDVTSESESADDIYSSPASGSESDGAKDPANSTDDAPYSSFPGGDSDSVPEISAPESGVDGDQVADQTGRRDLDSILRDYQVVDDPGGKVENYTADVLPGPLEGIGVDIWNGVTGDNVNLTLKRTITAKEATLLDGLGVVGFMDMRGATNFAQETARSRVGVGMEDGHGDAVRHATWNAVMTQEMGFEFAQTFANAHEGLPGNPADKEAMDLYNNEVGRQIALENPGATHEELADLVMEALNEGRLIVIDGNGELAWSDQVALGQTGYADDAPAQGQIDPQVEVNSH
jgi:hypothetical protein